MLGNINEDSLSDLSIKCNSSFGLGYLYSNFKKQPNEKKNLQA